MQWVHLLRHHAVIKFVSCLLLYTIFLWSMQGFVLATTTSTTSTDPVVADTTEPGISYAGAYNITRNSVTIQWNSNEPADGLVEYGPTTAYGSTVSDANITNNPHSLTFSGLTGGTLYHYRIKAKDAAGNQSIGGDLTFTTSAGCVQDSDCAGTPVWGGATFCNPPGSSPTAQVSKYQTKPVCNAGTCTTQSAPAVWEDCSSSGKICGFASTGGGTFQCVLNPGVTCTLDSQITSACLCGAVSYAEYGYCCLGADQKPFQSSSACSPVVVFPSPPPSSPTPPSTPTSTPSTSNLTPSLDTQPPSVPTGLTATIYSAYRIDISWSSSGDNTAVAGYKIYRNGVYYVSTANNTYFDNMVSSDITYNYTVAAYDGAGNVSAQSSPVSACSGCTAPGLIGHWKFDGNGNNEVAGKPSAIIVGNAEFNSSGGKLGGFLYIPTSADWAKIPYNSVYDLPNSFTIEFWFRQRSNQSFNQDLVYKGSAPNNYNFKIFRYLWNQYNNGAVIAGSTALGTGYWHQASNQNEPPHNVWHHVVYTRSLELQAYYIDGVSIYTQSLEKDYAGPVKTPAVDIIIGKSAPDTDIDNLKIYNRALSASEVAENGGFPLNTSPSPSPPPSTSQTATSTPVSSLPSISPSPTSTQTTPSYPTSTQVIPYVLVPSSTIITLPPTATSAPILPSPFLEVICADGTRVPSGAGCPGVVVFICANGERVKSPSECMPAKLSLPTDAITLCVSYGAVWCLDRCVARGSICGGIDDGGFHVIIDAAQVKEFEAQKRELLREIRAAERVLRQAKQNPDVLEVSRLKDKLEDVKLRESPEALQDLAVLQQAAEKLNQRAEEARERRLQEPGAAEADVRTKEKNLRSIKQQIRPFERHLATLESRVKEFEKAGIAIDPAVKVAIVEARGIARKIKIAKNYDATDETIEDMIDVAMTLNDLAPAVESASHVLKVVRLLERQIVTADHALQQTVKLAKRLKLDSSEDIGEMRALLEQAKVAVVAIKTGGIDKELLLDYSEMQILDAVAEVLEIADHFRFISNVRRHIVRVTSNLKQYDSRIRREERKKKDMANVRVLVDEGREHLAGLQKLAASRLTVENAEAMLELMRGINDVKEELDELLGIAKPSAIERDLERVIESGGTKVKSYNVDAVEKLLI